MKTKKGLAIIYCLASSMIASYMLTHCEPFWRAFIIVVLIITSFKAFEYLKKE